MTWNNGRHKEYIPVAVRRAVDERADGRCEAQRRGCLIDERLEYHHVIGVGEWTGPCEQLNGVGNIALLCHYCHNLETQAQVSRALNAWKQEPERHPGLKW